MITLISSLSFIVWFTVIAVIAIIISLESEREGVASSFLSLVLALLLWNYSSEILTFLNDNLLSVIGFSIAYVLIGIGWSFLKWTSKVKAIFKKFGKIKDEFEAENGVLTDENLAKFNKKIDYKFKYSDNSGDASINSDDKLDKTIKLITPRGESYKSIIIAWISYWPLSVIGTIFNNPFRQFFNWVYESVSGAYDRITQNQIQNYVK